MTRLACACGQGSCPAELRIVEPMNVVVCRLKEWMDSLRGGQPVNVSLFEMVAEEHNVDIYVLQPEVNRQTRQGFLHALRFSAVEGVSQQYRTYTSKHSRPKGRLIEFTGKAYVQVSYTNRLNSDEPMALC